MHDAIRRRLEGVARAICARSGVDPDEVRDGRPAWKAFIEDAEAMLQVRFPPIGTEDEI